MPSYSKWYDCMLVVDVKGFRGCLYVEKDKGDVEYNLVKGI